MKRAQLADDLAAAVIADAVSWRRHLHQHPELAFSERETSDFIAARLEEMGLKVHRGLGTTGVVGSLTRGVSKRAIGIRADMDGLPIQERSAAPHASGSRDIMHACGHDGHVAIALAAARICSRLSDLDGTVHFIFQPGEESGAGAKRMMDDGLFRLFPCSAVYGLHNWPALPLGTCMVRDGPIMAAVARFEIVVRGRGCHGAMPHEGTDALLAGCQLVSTLQSIVSRTIDPLRAGVVSATQIRAGDAFNVIPDTCFICGTTRWVESSVGELIERRLGEISRSVAAAFGCEVDVRYEHLLPATVNDATAASLVRTVASSSTKLTLLDAAPSMGAEDFAFMLQAVPGCYVWLGTGRSADDPGLHSPNYDFNDEAMPLGVALWVELVRNALTR
jgi:amidohydrolase